jgi:serine/threonine protein phosphatase 1
MSRARLVFSSWPAAVYAIGDVHGCLPQLLALERQILADGEQIAGEKWIIPLGDYVDRGPDSAGVIEHLLQPLPEGWRRFPLVGNHELMMLGFLADPAEYDYWLPEGGVATLRSYGVAVPQGIAVDRVRPDVPLAHLEFIEGLAISLSLPGWYFVHAGIRPGIPLANQRDDDLTWIRWPFLDAAIHPGFRVVHGHTPSREQVVTPARIGIDTQCYATGTLTALRVLADGGIKFLSVSS